MIGPCEREELEVEEVLVLWLIGPRDIELELVVLIDEVDVLTEDVDVL